MKHRDGWTRSALVLVAAFFAFSAALGQELATGTPGTTIQTLHSGLIAAAKQQSASLEERYRALQPLIDGTHDLAYIAEFAIRRQWPSLSVEERQRFIAAFEKLSVMTYASRFKNVSDSTFKPAATSQPDAGRAQVTTAIKRADMPDLPLEYLLHEQDGAWKIINIIADGVSDLALKRAEYQGILAKGSISDLIAHLDEQTARLQ